MRKQTSITADLIKGAIAGAVATPVLDQVTNFMYERESSRARHAEDRARQGTAAYETAAEKIARRHPSLRRAWGAAFGTAFWASVDEGLVSLAGLTPPPNAFPALTHLRGLAGHLAFGVVTDRTCACSTQPPERLQVGTASFGPASWNLASSVRQADPWPGPHPTC